MCPKHMYFGPSKVADTKPKQGCSECWLVYFLHDIASVPPSQREQRLEELTEVIHKLNEHVEKGTWDFTPNRHAQIEFESEQHQAENPSPIIYTGEN
jgi:hypothetical protein